MSRSRVPVAGVRCGRRWGAVVIAAGVLASAGVLAGVRFVEAVRFPAADGTPDAQVDVREVRAYLRRVLDGAGVDLGDVDLMVAEVVTNAVRHTRSGRPGGQVWAAVIATDAIVRVEITDQGGTQAEPCIPPYPVLGGRGLLIVQQLAARWDWSRDDDGHTTVWFEALRTGGTAGWPR